MQKETDNKNLFLAIGLSILVIVGWNYFYASPQLERQRQERQQGQTQSQLPQPGQPAPSAGNPALPGAQLPVNPGDTNPGRAAPAAPGAALTRDAALALSPRLPVETPRLRGSIALKGGRIDDLLLSGYKETIQPNSPNITLLSPSGTPNPYYAEFGWVPGTGAAAAVPNADTVWTASADRLTPAAPVTLTWANGQGLTFRRQIAVDNDYMFTVTDTVENATGQPVSLFPYGLVSRHGTPETAGFYILHEGLIGVQGGTLQEVGYSDLAKAKLREFKQSTGGFMGITDKYWATALVPDQRTPHDGRFLAGTLGQTPTYQADILLPAQTAAPGGTATAVTRLFAGAKEVNVVDRYKDAFNITLFDRLIDWGWFWYLTQPLFKMIDFFFKIFGNFGVAILLATVVIKLAFFPLANRSYVSMAKMKAVQPKMVEIQQRYKDDRMKQQQELMALYKAEKINPLAGCWPVLLQIPVFFALYKVLFVTIEMRHAPFFGWIKDLAAPDPTSIFNLFGLLPFTVPQFLLVGVWPIIMGITMWLQMKMNPEPTDPVQKAVFGWMPLIFTFMLASFPAGLVIYWAWNNILSVAQQYYIMKRQGVKVELWDNISRMFKPKTAG
jgi:YidC/Oxa1 family membrane protein insertase